MDELLGAIERILAAADPGRILALGPEAPPLIAAYADTRTECRVVAIDVVPEDHGARALADLGRHDFAVLGGVLEPLGRSAGEALVARIRDLHAPRMLTVYAHRGSGGWNRSDFIAMGMKHLGEFGAGEQRRALYGFDIASYKATPDWLNAKNWAHPDRWDQDRW